MGAAWLVALAAAAGASAHGDAAAHYLETESLLSSLGSPPAQAVELQLLGLVEATAEQGYPVKVMLIASEYDTGGEPEPLADPRLYAEHLAMELEAVGRLHGPVIVVTPDAFGIAGHALARADAEALAAGIEPARRADGDALAEAAMAAVREVARAGGRPLPASVPPAVQPPVPLWALTLQRERSGGEEGVGVWVALGAVALGLVPLLAGGLASFRRRGLRAAPS